MTNSKFDAKKDQLAGTIKEKTGQFTGNKKTETEGTIEKITGKAKETLVDTKNILKDSVDKAKETFHKD